MEFGCREEVILLKDALLIFTTHVFSYYVSSESIWAEGFTSPQMFNAGGTPAIYNGLLT